MFFRGEKIGRDMEICLISLRCLGDCLCMLEMLRRDGKRGRGRRREGEREEYLYWYGNVEV